MDGIDRIDGWMDGWIVCESSHTEELLLMVLNGPCRRNKKERAVFLPRSNWEPETGLIQSGPKIDKNMAKTTFYANPNLCIKKCLYRQDHHQYILKKIVEKSLRTGSNNRP
jgi:hypothetical protein